MAEEIRAAIEQVQGAQSCAAVMRSRAHWGPAAASLARIKVRSTCNGPAATACTSSPQSLRPYMLWQQRVSSKRRRAALQGRLAAGLGRGRRHRRC